MLLLFLLLGFALALQKVATPPDAALAARIQAGDAQAFRQFFERYHRLLFRYLRARRVPEEVTEDLVQQAFIIVWEKRATIDPERSLRSLLFRIAHNRALNHFRDTARFVGDEALPEQQAPGATEAAAELGEVEATLEAAIDALPPKRQAVFRLCFLHELTYREAAEVLDVSIKTVENHMGLALKSVRQALAHFRT